jgi:hypothetical protein
MVEPARGEQSARAAANAATLERELSWLEDVVERCVAARIEAGPPADVTAVPPPEQRPGDSMYADFVDHYGLCVEERLCVVLALAPHVRPQALDLFYRVNEALGRGYTDFGGVHGKMHGGFLPTVETALFLLAGGDFGRRFASMPIFDRDLVFAAHNILRLETPPSGEPLCSGRLVLADDIVDLLTTGELRKPDYSRDFPAKLIDTDMDWDDLVLPSDTLEQIHELEAWIRHEQVLMGDWGLARRLRPGYRCLLYGPPGTGKTLAASLLGKRVGRDVYRVALSTVVSKYIGETEKNLERIFTRAESMSCLLFFDEADALFGKRTNVSDAHDRYANQEVAYLLQRIEDFPGVVILASNYSSNIDDAFMRRFQAVVHFPLPEAAERERLWAASFSEESVLDADVAFDEIALQYELSGGAMMNVVRYASLMALEAGDNVVRNRDIIDGIRRELNKDGRTF